MNLVPLGQLFSK